MRLTFHSGRHTHTHSGRHTCTHALWAERPQDKHKGTVQEMACTHTRQRTAHDNATSHKDRQSRREWQGTRQKHTHKKNHVKISFRNFENPMKQYRTCLDLHEAGNVIIEPKIHKVNPRNHYITKSSYMHIFSLLVWCLKYFNQIKC